MREPVRKVERLLPRSAHGGTPSVSGVPQARSVQEADIRERGIPASRRPPDKCGGSRRPVGPLGGPCCARQTGYRNVLYEASWTAAEPPPFAPPPRGPAKVHDCSRGCRGRRAVGPRSTVAVKPSRAAMTSTDARRCWSTQPRLREEKSRGRVANARRRVQLRTTRRASAARSASSRSRSLSPWSTYCIAAAIARWPACSAMSRCIVCAIRR